MALYAKTRLSGSTDGKSINVVATASPGTTIHTGSTTPTHVHEVWLYAANYGSIATFVTVEFGGTGASERFSVYVEPNLGMQLVVPGMILNGNATPNVIRAFAGTANTVSIYGYVNTIV